MGLSGASGSRFISGISIALILFTALVVFLVFKCYSRSKGGTVVNSYTVEEKGPLPGPPLPPPPPFPSSRAAEWTGSGGGTYVPSGEGPGPPVATRVSSLNGYAPMKPVTPAKKTKDFKEWYV